MKTLVEWVKEKIKRKPLQDPPPTDAVEEQMVAGPEPVPHVYVNVRLYGPLQGIHTYEPEGKPWIKIEGVTLAEAAMRLSGRGLDWNTLPKAWIERLEMTPQCITLPWEQVKAFVQG